MSNSLYSSLQAGEIRLLTLHSGDQEDEIRTSLQHVKLEKPCEYDALSYAWGKSVMAEPFVSDPETEVQVAILRPDTRTPGNVRPQQVERVKWKDLRTHSQSYLYYEAGGERLPEDIRCSDHKITIGGELHSALKRLRKTDVDRIMWIDALCINQSDFDERAAQVRMMAEIYEHAKHVLVWLGENYGNVDAVPETIYGISRGLVPFWKDAHEHDRKDGRSDFRYLSHHAFKADPAIQRLNWDSLAELLKRGWFQRIWCLQEVVNGDKDELVFVLGVIEIPFKLFAMVMYTLRQNDLDSFLWSRGECAGSETMNLIMDLSMSRANNVRPTLYRILQQTRSMKSTLAVDKLYGLLNLVSDADESGVIIDYTADPSKVYTDFAINHMQRHKSLAILNNSGADESTVTTELRLPSWVPNWTLPIWHDIIPSEDAVFCAGGHDAPDFHFSTDRKILHIQGHFVDSVDEIELIRKIPRNKDPNQAFQRAPDAAPWAQAPSSQPWYFRHSDGKPYWESSHETFLEEARVNRRAWINNAMAIAFPKKTCTPVQFEAFWRTFVWDLTPENLKPDAKWGEVFSQWLTFVTATEEEAKAQILQNKANRVKLDLREEVPDVDPQIKVIEERMRFGRSNARAYNRRFFRSTAGRLGWGVNSIQKGDRICVLKGGHMPYILRPAADGCYTLVGDAYVHGIMFGEGMVGQDQPIQIV